jgi:hypothetical protein
LSGDSISDTNKGHNLLFVVEIQICYSILKLFTFFNYFNVIDKKATMQSNT